MNKEFERCCTQIAKMMEKYSSMILQDNEKEIKYRLDILAVNTDTVKSRFTTYMNYFSAYHSKAA